MTSNTAVAHGDAPGTDPLQVRSSSRWQVRAVWLVGLAVVVVVVAFVTAHPDELPTSDTVVTASTPVGRPVYLGVLPTPSDFGRRLDISGVKVFAESTVPVTITPHLCHGGSLGVTSQPDLFCASVGPTEGATLGADDAIVLEVTGKEPGVVSIDRIRVAYHDGLQRATQKAGSPAVVTILAPA